MAHRTRGHRAGTWEITELVDIDIDTDELTLAVRHTGAFQPKLVRLRPVSHTAAAEQTLRAMAASMTASPTADRDSAWESVETVVHMAWVARVLLNELAQTAVDSFADERVDIALLRSLYAPLMESAKRNAVHLLARILKAEHPNGRPLAYALKNTRFAVEETSPFTYDEDVADAIETPHGESGRTSTRSRARSSSASATTSGPAAAAAGSTLPHTRSSTGLIAVISGGRTPSAGSRSMASSSMRSPGRSPIPGCSGSRAAGRR
jgi:hypothetical protein